MKHSNNLLKWIPLLTLLWLLYSCSGNPGKPKRDANGNPLISQIIRRIPFVKLPYREVLTQDKPKPIFIEDTSEARLIFDVDHSQLIGLLDTVLNYKVLYYQVGDAQMPSIVIYDKTGKIISDKNISMDDFAGADCSVDSSFCAVSIDKAFNISAHEFIKMTECDSNGHKKTGTTHFVINEKRGHLGSEGVLWEKNGKDIAQTLSQEWKTDSIYINTLKPITGYRFVLTGDFNGDGVKDTLTEHYISLIDKKETNKQYEGLDYDRAVTAAVHKDPFSFVTSTNSLIDTLYISSTGQLFGISYMKNEGDLDGDGGDEVSYVVDWADWSSLNTCHIVSFKHGKWKELYSFETRDWVLPSLPDVQTEYGLFGVAGASSTVGNDTANKQILMELKAFPGLVTKLKSGKIKIHTFLLAEDTTLVVDLRRKK